MLKYLHGSIYLNMYSSGAGEIAGKLSVIPMLRCVSLRRLFMIAFSLASLGCLLLILFRNTDAIIPVLVLITRFAFS